MVLHFGEKFEPGNRLFSNTTFLLPFKSSVSPKKFIEVGGKSTWTSPALSLVVLESAMWNERQRCSANLCCDEHELSSSQLPLSGKRDRCELIS
jgi:hypothetical protein